MYYINHYGHQYRVHFLYHFWDITSIYIQNVDVTAKWSKYPSLQYVKFAKKG